MSSPIISKIVCDFCGGSVSEAWFFAHFAFEYVVAGQWIRGEVGEAAACSVCRLFVEKGDAKKLLGNAILIGSLIGCPLTPLVLPSIKGLHKNILANLTGRVRYMKLGDVAVVRSRFFELPCPRCGASNRIDRDEAQRNCGACGLKMVVGPVGFAKAGRRPV